MPPPPPRICHNCNARFDTTPLVKIHDKYFCDKCQIENLKGENAELRKQIEESKAALEIELIREKNKNKFLEEQLTVILQQERER
jgi:hypothetical protein